MSFHTGPETNIEIKKQFYSVVESELPLANLAGATVFVTFAFSVDGRPLFSSIWLMSVAGVFLAVTAVDALSPSMSSAIRLSLPFIFYAKSG